VLFFVLISVKISYRCVVPLFLFLTSFYAHYLVLNCTFDLICICLYEIIGNNCFMNHKCNMTLNKYQWFDCFRIFEMALSAKELNGQICKILNSQASQLTKPARSIV